MSKPIAPLAESYLASNDPRGQSGFAGSEERWELLRRPIAAALDRDGTFLDIGCANGYLMRSLREWSSFRYEMHGVDIAAELVELAKTQCPEDAVHLYAGDAFTWFPPKKFDFVHTEVVYVEEAKRAEYIERLLRDVVRPGGRLIVTCYAARTTLAAQPLTNAAELLTEWGHRVEGTAIGRDFDGIPLTSVAWIDNH